MVILLSVAFAPGLALFSFFYLKNQMATEPRKTLLQTFIYGAILTFPIMFLQYVLKEEQVFTHPLTQSILFSSVIEEVFKWLILILVVYHYMEFDDPYDGVLYGVTVSLGFATVENIFYLMTYGINTAFLRALLPVSSHALFGVVMGYYLGKAKFNAKNQQKLLLSCALIIPMFLHISYNAILALENNWLYAIIPFTLFLWWFSLRKVKQAHIALLVLLHKQAEKEKSSTVNSLYETNR